MHIQWFPGHMTKSMRMIKDNMPVIDAVVYVLDSRAPASCLNPEFDKLIAGKSVVYVLNKSDLADAAATEKWLRYFKKSSYAVAIDATRPAAAKTLNAALLRSLSQKAERRSARGLSIPFKVIVLGIPNSGKSTIINSLCGGKRAKTGNKPGVTRGKQWLSAGGLEVLDTPGTLWNAFADKLAALNLAYIGSINDDVLDMEQLAVNFISHAEWLYPQSIYSRYGIKGAQETAVVSERVADEENTAEEDNYQASVKSIQSAYPAKEHCDMPLDMPQDILSLIAGARGYILRGQPDTLRAAHAVIDDFRKGRLGRMTLELPQDDTAQVN